MAQRALAQRKALVLLFYGGGADDRGVRRELAKVGRRGGRVKVMSAPIARLASFGSITAGVKVLGAPTVVVVGPSGSGRSLPGYVDSTEIDQAVAAALR